MDLQLNVNGADRNKEEWEMKKGIAALCLLAMVLGMLGGCRKTEPEASQSAGASPEALPVIHMCVDAAYTAGGGSPWPELLDAVPGMGREFTVLREALPVKDPERDAQLTRIRTEVMAGKGPDLFFCDCLDIYYLPDVSSGALFPFPEAAMDRRIFLPLDDYIAKAQRMEWDQLLPAVMEAGRGEEGQMLLPLAYRFAAMGYDREKFQLKEALPMTWDQMLESQDQLVQNAAALTSFDGVLGALADYDREELRFSQEELLLRAEQVWGQEEKWRGGQLDEIYEWNEEAGFFRPKEGVEPLNFGNFERAQIDGHADLSLSGKEYIMVPLYNTAGGVTAQVTAFAAINRNTQFPEECFRVLDTLLSKSQLQKSGIYACMGGIAPYQGLGSSTEPFCGWHMNDWNWEQFNQIVGQINAAQFYTPLNEELGKIVPERFNNGTPMEKIVPGVYRTMEMLLAES